MRDEFKSEAKFEILEHYATLSTDARGWTLEFNKVSWEGKPPVYEIRRWGPDHKIIGKGTTLYDNELKALAEILKDQLEEQI